MRRSGTIRTSGSASVLTTTLAAVHRAETARPSQPGRTSSTQAVPTVCIQPDASIAVAFKQRSCASSLRDNSPRSVGPHSTAGSHASERLQHDDFFESSGVHDAGSRLGRLSQNGQPRSGLSTQWSRHSSAAQLRPPAASLPRAETAPGKAATSVPGSLHAPPATRHGQWEEPSRHHSSHTCMPNTHARLSCPVPRSNISDDFPDNPLHPSGFVPFSRLPARELPSAASDSRLHLWLQNDVLNSHSCV